MSCFLILLPDFRVLLIECLEIFEACYKDKISLEFPTDLVGLYVS